MIRHRQCRGIQSQKTDIGLASFIRNFDNDSISANAHRPANSNFCCIGGINDEFMNTGSGGPRDVHDQINRTGNRHREEVSNGRRSCRPVAGEGGRVAAKGDRNFACSTRETDDAVRHHHRERWRHSLIDS